MHLFIAGARCIALITLCKQFNRWLPNEGWETTPFMEKNLMDLMSARDQVTYLSLPRCYAGYNIFTSDKG